MSWPADGLPRFKVISHPGDGFARIPPTGYVLDRANCHREVVRYTAVQEVTARERATTVAAILEAGGDVPQAVLPEHVSHGTINAYKSYECRCEACCEAQRDVSRAWRAKQRAKKRAAAL